MFGQEYLKPLDEIIVQLLIHEYFPNLSYLSESRRTVYLFFEIVLLSHKSLKKGKFNFDQACEYVYISKTYQPMIEFLDREDFTDEEIRLLFEEIDLLMRKK